MKTLRLFLMLIVPWMLLSCDDDSDGIGPNPSTDKCNTIAVPELSMCFSFTGSANEGINDDQAQVEGATLTTDRNGQQGSAYDFDGVDDYIRVPNPTYKLNGSFTFSAWIFMDESTPESGNVRILDTRNASFSPNNSLNIYLNLTDELLRVAGQGISFFDLDYDLGTWFQLTVVYDETEVTEKVEVYVNGVEVDMAQDGFTGHIYDNEDIIIGARADLVEVFNGKIDDILVFDRAFEENELVQLLTL